MRPGGHRCGNTVSMSAPAPSFVIPSVLIRPKMGPYTGTMTCPTLPSFPKTAIILILPSPPPLNRLHAKRHTLTECEDISPFPPFLCGLTVVYTRADVPRLLPASPPNMPIFRPCSPLKDLDNTNCRYNTYYVYSHICDIACLEM